jgi:mannose-6-phosphate isomerase-like protein (cupin superfamily)
LPGYVIDETAVEARREEGDTATTRVTIDDRCGCERLEQRVLTFAPGRSRARTSEGGEEILYVVSGRGTLVLGGTEHPLEPEMGVYVAPGEGYAIDNPGPGELKLLSVVAPAPNGATGDWERPVTVRYAEQPILPAGKDREFRYVINTRGATQFVGSIPPGRAKDHYHLYDEVVYILQGQGVLHLEGRDDTPIAAGSCIHLPPPLPHCLENVGSGPMRVLGVFHPSGSPAEAYHLPGSGGEGGRTA